MRHLLILLPIAALASPVAAQAPATPPATQSAHEIRIPPELTDPAMTDARPRHARSAVEGVHELAGRRDRGGSRGPPVTPADRNRTVRDVAGAGDPNFEANFQRDIAASRATMQAGMKAMVAALPAISRRTEPGWQRNRARHRQPALADLSPALISR